jgi:hypothetical protein
VGFRDVEVLIKKPATRASAGFALLSSAYLWPKPGRGTGIYRSVFACVDAALSAHIQQRYEQCGGEYG